MDSYMETLYNHNHHNQQPNSGLLRFRSLPSSLINVYSQNSSDSEKLIGRLEDDFSGSYEKKPLIRLNSQDGYSSCSQIVGDCGEKTQLPPQYPKQSLVNSSNTSMQRSNSLEMDHSTRQGNGGLNLSRQSSSPAGFFNHLNPQNGYTIMRSSVGNLRAGNDNTTNSESRLNISHLPRIPETTTNENVKETSSDGMNFTNHEGDAGFVSPAGFSFASMIHSDLDASHLSENGSRLTSRPNVLLHHLSLPKTSAEMAAVQNLLHYEDTVPCKIRAKRGFATHPRSIAERVRRNRISERMRKLQELVPNMDKQTNTADMLDLAVNYIKNLQNQHKVLSKNRAKCTCVNLQHSVRNQAV